MTDSEILKYAVSGAEVMLSNSTKLKERMDKNGVTNKALDRLIKDYQNKLDELNDMLIIATSVENFCAMSKGNQAAELANLLCGINA